jgi:CelD/BcsL family acetyltransferase involved in cellulose biosynthesis
VAIGYIAVATVFEQLLALRLEWLALEAEGGAMLPFQTWEWSVAWWTHLRATSIGVRDQLRVCVMRDANGRLVGVAPFILTERPAAGPLRLRHLQLMGADPNITEIPSIACLPAFEQECYEVLRQWHSSGTHGWDWVAWSGLARRTGVAEAMADNLIDHQVTTAFVLQLPNTWASLHASLGRNIKESLRKCYNSLKRDGLSYLLETVDDPLAIDDALTDFFHLHTARARLEGAPQHPDVFESPQARAFLREVCQRLGHRGIVRIFRLWVGNQVVATRIGFELGRSLYLYYSGWDPAFGKYSVMTTLVCEVIMDAIVRGIRSVNLSIGRDVSKTRWSPIELDYLSGVQLADRPARRALYRGHELLSRPVVRNIARKLLPQALVRRPR